MDNAKYIGMDVHKETISIAVLNAAGKLVMECVDRNQGQHDRSVYPRTAR